MAAWLASLLWLLEQWGTGYVLPGTLPTDESRAWRA